jgi:hypothetical protein
MKKINSLLFISFFMIPPAFSQVNKEIGVRLTNLNNCDLILKKQKSENHFNRHRYAFGFNYTNIYGSQDIITSFGYHYAREKRKNIEGNFFFLYGLEPGISFALLSQTSGIQDLYVMPKIGYILALQYNIQSKLYVNLEIIPSLYTNFNTSNEDFRMGFNSSNVGLTFGYRFTKH